MAKKTIDLDTPFRKNERVITTRDLGIVGERAPGKVQLQNGLGPWIRYWVQFEDGHHVGQISHHDLVRPSQWDAWHKRVEEHANAAEQSASQEVEASDAPAAAGGGGGGIADQIPAAILERSKAAKARLLG